MQLRITINFLSKSVEKVKKRIMNQYILSVSKHHFYCLIFIEWWLCKFVTGSLWYRKIQSSAWNTSHVMFSSGEEEEQLTKSSSYSRCSPVRLLRRLQGKNKDESRLFQSIYSFAHVLAATSILQRVSSSRCGLRVSPLMHERSAGARAWSKGLYF